MVDTIYGVGACVVYGGNGVCRVTAVGPCLGQDKDYYTLSPLFGTEVIYVPVDSKVYMRPILSRGQAEALIRAMPAVEAASLEGMNLQAVTRYYQSVFQSHDVEDLIRLMKTTHQRSSAARKSGKQPGKVEEKYRKRAEDLLYGELSVSLDLSVEEVPEHIKRTLKCAEPA